METIIDNISVALPLALVAWGMLLAGVYLRPQSLLNCYLLFNAGFWSLFFVACCFGGGGRYVILGTLGAILVTIFLVPVILTVNGIVMLKRESKSLANALSLFLGIGIGIGEIVTFISLVTSGRDIRMLGLRVDEVTGAIGVTIIYFSIIILAFVLYSIFVDIIPHRNRYDYVVIHGCGLTPEGKVSNILRSRVDRAIVIYEKCEKKPYIIASGGQGEDEVCSEAFAMREYLLEKGIPDEMILLEDRSTTTMENLLYSKGIIMARTGGTKTALISSNYHVYRCLRYAKRLKFRCTGIGSRVALYYWPSALIREWVAVYSEKRKFIPMLIFWIFLMVPFVL